MKHSKRILFTIGLCFGMAALFSGCNPKNFSEEQFLIDEISNKWVPDHREGICSVSVLSGNNGSLVLKGETNIPEAKNEIINALDKSGIILVDSILILPDTTVNKSFYGLVSQSVINLRKEPRHSSELVSQAILGAPVMILKHGNYWSLIQTPDRYIAWTETSAVKLLTEKEHKEWKGASKVIFLENCGWIYDAPDAEHSIGDIVLGSVLVKIKETGVYTNVKYPDGREGFVKSATLADFDSWKKEAGCTEESICRIAETFLGLPYLWGGSSSKAVDCSGFVQSVFFRNGMIMSRDASLQAEHGISIEPSDDYNNYRRGDLLFFGTRTDKGLRITHVAIYKGDSEYIHSAGRVKINSLDSTRVNYSDFRRSSLLAVRRIAGFDGDDGAVPVAEHSWY